MTREGPDFEVGATGPTPFMFLIKAFCASAG